MFGIVWIMNERGCRYMALLGFIGVGSMGYPMLSGALKCFETDQILITTKTEQTMKSVNEKLGVKYVADKKE